MLSVLCCAVWCQLLEEMMDHGYPLTTEPNALKVHTSIIPPLPLP